MARSKVTKSSRLDEGTRQRSLEDQPTPFVGLGLAPLVAIVASWLFHMLGTGLTIGNRTLLSGSPTMLSAIVALCTLGTVIIGVAAWHFSYDRKPVWRISLTASTAVIGLWFTIMVAVGPNRVIDILFAIFAWIVVVVWSLPRLHVLRRDPRENDTGNGGEDDLMRELGLKGFKFGDPNIEYDDKGNETRRVYTIRHRLGATRQALSAALNNIESLFGAPENLSRVTKPHNGRSNQSVLTVLRQDPLIGRVPNPGLSHPGGSVEQGARIGRYDDLDEVWVYVFGGVVNGVKLPPTGYAFMGMTRAGKTVGENRLLLDGVITRYDGVICYFNQAKGDQDVAPIIDGVEVAVLSDNVSAYTTGFSHLKNVIMYRQRELARYGISAWSSDKCFRNPPQVTIDGRKEPMEPMPCLVVHVGESDSILETAGELAVFLASKGLSTGVVPGWSQQRWSATTMPTDLRFNVGTRHCFGVGDDYSAAFALSDPTIAAGAHPENWRNTKPGRFFVEGAGIDDTRWPVSAKVIGDDDDDALIENMRRDAAEWGPRMARLDQGSVIATRGWWARAATETNALRATLTGRGTGPTPVPDDPTPTVEMPMTPTAPAFNADPPAPDEDPAAMAAHQATVDEIATTTNVDGEEIYGELIRPEPPTGPGDDGRGIFAEMDAADPNAEIPPPPPDDVVLDDGKPEAMSRQEAELALDRALRALAADEGLRDLETDPTGRTTLIRTGQIQKLYPFRTRPWYSEELRRLADGERIMPDGLHLEKASDRTGEGWYRLIRTDGGRAARNGHAQ